MSLLSDLLDQAENEKHYTRLFTAYSRSTTHLARLLREKRLLPDQPADDLDTLLGQALDELGEELGIKL
jgi:hypothetical protein